MVALLVPGALLTVAGVLGLAWCIRKAAWIRRAELDDATAHAQLQRLILGHMAAVGAAFLGLGLLLTGFLLS